MKKSLSPALVGMWAIVLIFTLASVGTAKGQTVYVDTDTVVQGDTLIFCSDICSQVVLTSTVQNLEWQYQPFTSVYSPSITISAINNGIVGMLVNGSVLKIFYFYIVGSPVSPSLPDIAACGEIFTYQLDAGNANNLSKYLWSTGETSKIINVQNPGTYTVSISNTCGFVTDTVIVTTDHSNDADLGPDQVICLGEFITLGTNNSNIINYVWNTGSSQPSVVVSTSGVYSVTTTDNIGCMSSDTMNLVVMIPPSQDIHLVTIDTSNGNNRITWDGLLHGSAVTANIYRELTSNNYQLVGTAVYTTGTWTDTIDSRNQPWRYKISLVDTCGNEGIQSAYVQSIHSWVTATIGGGYTVQWTAYEVENKTVVDQYNIYYGNQLSQLNFLTFVSGSVTVYTMASFVDSVYVIGAQLSAKGAESDALSNWVSQNDALGIAEGEGRIEFLIYPNPATESINIQCEGVVYIDCFNIVGEHIFSSSEKEINVTSLPIGVYMIKITARDSGYGYKKFIKL